MGHYRNAHRRSGKIRKQCYDDRLARMYVRGEAMKNLIKIGIILLAACGGDEQQPPARETQMSSDDAPPPPAIDLQITQCNHTENAAIYGRPAVQWRAEHYGSEDPTSANLTVWQIKAGGANEFNFHLVHSGATYRIDTVEGSTKAGSGTVTVTRQDKGVQFVLSGKDGNG